jgi:hypothetical protein
MSKTAVVTLPSISTKKYINFVGIGVIPLEVANELLDFSSKGEFNLGKTGKSVKLNMTEINKYELVYFCP